MALEKYFEQLEKDKKRLANILNIKGIDATEDETFSTLVPKVNQIQGKKLAPVFINFSDDVNSTNLDDVLRCLSFSNASSLAYLFDGCENLTSVDLTLIGDTKNVTAMNGMFQSCSSIETLDLSSLDTSNVETMNAMFNFASKVKQINLNGLDTSKVTNMRQMFCACYRLEELDVSGFNTSLVTNMNRMFYGCGVTAKTITALNLTHFDVTNVTDMGYMFYNTSQLKTLDLSTWYAPNIKDVSYMFYNCSGLTTLDIRNFDFTSITSSTYYSNVFNGVPNGCRVIVKDDANKQWCLNKKSFTNIHTVAEL